MRDHVLDMRAIAAALTSAGIPAEVQPSGGNVATIYAGPPGHRIAIGPGWYSQDRPFCRASELSMAPEDGSADPVSLADAPTFGKLIRRLTDALPPRPGACSSVRGLECANHDHDHRWSPDNVEQAHSGDELACNDCGCPIFWDQATHQYWHTDSATPPCFLIPEVR